MAYNIQWKLTANQKQGQFGLEKTEKLRSKKNLKKRIEQNIKSEQSRYKDYAILIECPAQIY